MRIYTQDGHFIGDLPLWGHEPHQYIAYQDVVDALNEAPWTWKHALAPWQIARTVVGRDPAGRIFPVTLH